MVDFIFDIVGEVLFELFGRFVGELIYRLFHEKPQQSKGTG
jgi:hypothetical protein